MSGELVFQLDKSYQYETTGFQWSIWGAAFAGMELRYRILDYTDYFSPGGFLKVPVYKTVNRISDFNMHL
jgi:hypothetical protein